MFIIWGTKEKRKDKGYCASLCKICNDITPFKVTQFLHVSHLYYIPMGRYKFSQTELVCTTCKNALFSGSENSNCSKSDDLSTLIKKVPVIELELWKEEIEKHKRIQKDPSSLSPEDRYETILESFIIHENKLALAIEKGPNIDKSALLGCLPFLGLILFLIFLGESFMDSSIGQFIHKESGFDGFGIGASLIFLFGGSQVFWLVGTHKSKFFKKEIYPLLVISLSPLKPNIQELSQVKAELKKLNLNMRSFSIPKLQLALSEHQLVSKKKF